jgi:lactoylglutathione lyase
LALSVEILWVTPTHPFVLMGTALGVARHNGICYAQVAAWPDPLMRMLHTMLRVGDLERSLTFYTEVLGMRMLRRKDYPSGRFTLAFVGYGEERDTTVLELTHNWDTSHYDLGAGYGHIALGVEDIQSVCDAIRAKGGKVVREPGPMKHGNTVIAFVEDPDGYKVELIQLSTRG